jgi:hypothetical protein
MTQQADTTWTCSCGGASNKTWNEEIEPEWSQDERRDETRAGTAARQHRGRSNGDGHEIMVHVATDENPWVREDHDVIEVRGRITSFAFDTDKNQGQLTIRGLDGDQYEAELPSRAAAMLSHRPQYGSELTYGERVTIMDEEPDRVAEDCTDPAVFRIVQDETPWLFGVVSEKYEPVSVNDLRDAVQDVAEDLDVQIVREPDGQHGGIMDVTLGERGPAELSLFVNAGHKNGMESAQARARAEVLACQNMMTLDVDGLVADVPQLRFERRARHLPGSVEAFADDLMELQEVAEQFQTMTDAATSADVTEDDVQHILRFYVERGRISERTKNLVLQAWGDDDITQEPGTLYGLAMAATWVGTHGVLPNGNDLSGGVTEELQQIGGEMLIVAPSVDEYMDLVVENQPVEA